MEESSPQKDISDQTTQVDLTSVNAEETAAPAAPSRPRSRSSRRATAERLAKINEEQKKRSRRGFLTGLIVGQLAVVGLSYGGAGLQALLQDKIGLQTPMPIRSMVFCAMTAGIGLTGCIILLVLALQGIGWFFTKKTIGFGLALWRGVKRTCRAAWSLGLTLVVISGTAWLLIPEEEWQKSAEYLADKGDEGYGAVRTWIDGFMGETEEKPPE